MENIANSSQLIQIGIIVNTKGTEGELMLNKGLNNVLLPAGIIVYIGFSKAFTTKYILSQELSIINNKSIFKLNNITTKEQAAILKENAIFVHRDDILKYSNIKYLPSDLIGCEVIDTKNNNSIGKVIEVWNLPANDVWLVDTDNGELPLPVIDEVIKQVNINNKIIEVYMLDGLWDIVSKI